MPEKTFQGTETNPIFYRRLEGKIAIITGGAGGIGAATVRSFAKHGAKVVIADINDESGLALATSLSPLATYVHCNSKHKSIVDLSVEEFDNIMSVNVRGVALGMKHAARVMIPRKTGCIISTASVASVMGGMGPHAYTASKHAIVGLTKNAACELGKHGIRVNCISPFGVATSMLMNAWRNEDEDKDEDEIEKTENFVSSLGNLKGTTLKAKDIAEAALYLASDESRYVSGHNLVVDGAVTTSRNYVNL
ncbi:hypothetical protein L1987_12944 [Smallanthus sonchifolius]|uniref:Uncharacterized protein n=1 Tax=Smallanthus sonchifolius TaxID=185202 RepID=A0ACB9JFR0_9ASTR|nr:hypothetical protein L1987_12944 [Smallanthus sonchifolius]